MRAHILTVGDELLIGQVVNTNAAWIGEQLTLLGIGVSRMETVGDEEEVIRTALARASEEADLIVITGGLGPTHDDITKQVVAAFLDVDLVEDPDILAGLEAYFVAKYGRMPAGNQLIALVPEGFDVLPNPIGTAPGLWGTRRFGEQDRHVVLLPGVPYEMKALMEQAVLPRLLDGHVRRVVRHRTLLTAGIGESNLTQRIGDLDALLGDRVRLAFLPNPRSGVRMRLTAGGGSVDEADARLALVEAQLRERVGRYLYGSGVDSLESVVGAMLRERGATVAFAESCTGGLLASRMTDVPGSSAYVAGGVVAYSNDAKVQLLGVDREDLELHGAVSEPVALQMAAGIRERLGASVGVSTTGIAGPTGGTPDKPVGTVWIGIAGADGVRARRLQLARERLLNKELAATFALDGVRRRMLREKAS